LDFGSLASGEPKHERLRRFLAGQIAGGRLAPGDPLPTELQLAELLGIARLTLDRHQARRRRVVKPAVWRDAGTWRAVAAAHPRGTETTPAQS